MTGNISTIPRTSITPTSQSTVSGGDAVFTCHGMKSHIRAVEWYKDKRKLPDKLQTKLTSGDHCTNILTLMNVNGSVAGTYECRVFKKFKKSHLRDYSGYWVSTAELQVQGSGNNHRVVYLMYFRSFDVLYNVFV